MTQTETAVLPGASHLLQIQQPAGAARLLADFLNAHPTDDSVTDGQTRSTARARPRRDPDRYNAAADLLDGNLETDRADKVAIKDPGGDWTYADVAAGPNQTGNALRALGVQIENRVLLVVADSAEFATAFFGANKIGAVPVPVNTDSPSTSTPRSPAGARGVQRKTDIVAGGDGSRQLGFRSSGALRVAVFSRTGLADHDQLFKVAGGGLAPDGGHGLADDRNLRARVVEQVMRQVILACLPTRHNSYCPWFRLAGHWVLLVTDPESNEE